MPLTLQTDWIRMEEVLEHSSVVDWWSFIKCLRLLLEQAVYATFYANLSLDGQKLSSTERAYPTFSVNEVE